MALTLGTAGMDHDTEVEVLTAFKIANTEIGQRWTLVADDAADYFIIDMDSLSGPISWLRQQGMGRTIIGLTSAERCSADYRLARPISAVELAALLRAIADGTALPPMAAPTPETPASEPEIPEPEAPSKPETLVATEPPHSVEPEPKPGPAQRLLRDWLRPGQLQQRVRLQRDEILLLIDPQHELWHGSSTLKPLTSLFEIELAEDDFERLESTAWDTAAATLGPAQPLLRLRWLGGLLSGAATDGHYLLKKWPQTEREYPQHFRIATAMMKGPASIAELAAASHVSEREAADFVNANLATGYAEEAVEPPAPDGAPQKPHGLFGRLRSH